MDLPSSVAVLLQGFDAWVLAAKPSCEVASRVLHALQQTASQQRSVRDSIDSIPVLLRKRQFPGAPPLAPLQLPTFTGEPFLF
jgi:hypothetical protein